MATMFARSPRVVLFGRSHIQGSFGAIAVNQRDKSTQSLSLTALKKGRGGRSSFSGVVATVFGSSGFLGKYIVNKLGKTGSQVILPYRCDPYYMLPLRLCGDLGQIQFVPFELKDEDSIRKSVQYSNVVINLISREWETKNFKHKDVHVEGARQIARISKEMGVEKLIHFSALNASANPQTIWSKNGSAFLRAKHAGEMAVKEEFPEAIIFRPSDIYGASDRFLNYYISQSRRSARGKMIELWKKGDHTIKQPVFVSDVAEGVLQAVHDPTADGKTFDIVGSERYFLADLIQFIFKSLRFDYMPIVPLSPGLRLKAFLYTLTPFFPGLDVDKLEREFITDEQTANPNLEDLGVKLTRFEDQAAFELKQFKLHSYYNDAFGEFKDAPPPQPVSAYDHTDKSVHEINFFKENIRH